MSFSVKFTRRFSMAHRLSHDAAPKCATPHGHNEFVTIELVRPGAPVLCGSKNMVQEFGQLKAAWHRWIDESVDHCLQLNENDPLLQHVDAAFPDWRIMVTPGDPTTELTAALFMTKCQAFLDADATGFHCKKLTLQETPTNSVTVEGLPLQGISFDSTLDWWTRPDASIR
jgi:6-pyruvoyltetrahydropterin/6-carboxytetrahydropterin synthase